MTIAAAIARLRSLLSVPQGVVRLTGVSGTGKTRLLEALFDCRIGDQPLDPAQAVYVDIGHEPPVPSAAQLANRLVAEGKRTILVIDNCPRDTHDTLAPICAAPNSQLSLITVDLDIREDRPGGTGVFRLQNASEAVIEALIERRYPHLSQAICRRIADFSGGNSRIANLAAQQVGPNANIADLGDEKLFEKLFHQNRQVDLDLQQAAEALSLLYSFHGEALDGDYAELPLLASCAGVHTVDLYRAVAELQRREIIQARGPWRAIVPQPIGNWLAKRALQNMPAPLIADAVWNRENARSLKSFTHRLSYLHDSPGAKAIAVSWLGIDGPLGSLCRPNPLWVDITHNLAPVAPEAALALVEHWVMTTELRELIQRAYPHWHSFRYLLRKLAYFSEYFPRAVLVMVRLIHAEMAAKGSDTEAQDLEQLFWAKLAGTQASPRRRLDVVEELLSQQDAAVQGLGLIALRGMLRGGPVSSSHDFSFGGYAIDFGWWPRSPSDYQEWYGGALSIAMRLALSDDPHRKVARRLIAEENFRDLWRFGRVVDLLEKAALELASQEYWPEGWVAVRRTRVWDAERMEADLLERLQTLEGRLAPDGLADRIRIYVLTPGARPQTPNVRLVERNTDKPLPPLLKKLVGSANPSAPTQLALTRCGPRFGPEGRAGESVWGRTWGDRGQLAGYLGDSDSAVRRYQ